MGYMLEGQSGEVMETFEYRLLAEEDLLAA